MTTFKDSRRITQAAIQEDAADQGLVYWYHYFGHVKHDASANPSEIFINGVEGQRLYLPVDSMVIGTLWAGAWNKTDNSAATAAGVKIDFAATNDSGTIAFTPINLSGSGSGNPIIQRNMNVGTITVAGDSTNDAIRLNFTGANDKEYFVRAYAQFVLVGKDSRSNVNYHLSES